MQKNFTQQTSGKTSEQHPMRMIVVRFRRGCNTILATMVLGLAILSTAGAPATSMHIINQTSNGQHCHQIADQVGTGQQPLQIADQVGTGQSPQLG
jgi:hypothetical protein